MGKVDYELLEANRERLLDGYGDGSSESIKDFVESTRPIEVSDEEVEVFLMPYQQNYKRISWFAR